MHGCTSDDLLVEHLDSPRRPMRIAAVTETYPPEVNGVSLTVQRMVLGLRERNHDVQLIRPRQGSGDLPDARQRSPDVLLRGLPIPRYPHLKMGLPATRALISLWSHRRPDVVHIATEGPLGWSALRAAERLRLPVVSDFRTNFHAYSRHYGLGWLNKPIVAYLRKFHNRTARTLVPTRPLRADLEALGFRNVQVVARGVDTQVFNPSHRSQSLRAQWGAGPDTLVLLCVSRLAPEKNIALALEAFAGLRRAHPDVRLVLVGDGPARAALAQQCPQAVFAGMRRGADLSAHYASADLFLFPSLTETFGNVVPEAMASGLPVLAFDCAAAGQLIRSGDNGLLVRTGSTADFVDAAARAATDAAALRTLGQRARATAEALDWARIVDELEGALLHVSQQGAAPQDSLRLRPSTA